MAVKGLPHLDTIVMNFETERANWRLSVQALVLVCISFFASFVFRLYSTRARFVKLRRQGLTLPPHHPILGHLLLAKNLLSCLPKDAHPSVLPGLLKRAFPDVGQVFYLDMWPFSRPLLVVSSPSVAYQFSQERPLRKSPELRRWMRPLADNQDLVSLEGPTWKKWRNVYNPGFSASHLISLVPLIAEQVLVFCDILRERTKEKAVFPLEEATMNLTMDTIGRIVLGTRLDAQKARNSFVNAFHAEIPWHLYGTEMNPFVRFNPLRPILQWYYVRRMDSFISRQLEDRYVARRESAHSSKMEDGEYRTVMDLALDEYLKQHARSSTSSGLDPEFKRWAISQMKVFILAGHDNTSSTICYMLLCLSRNHSALQRVQAEHDEVFGSSLEETKATITANPHTLNRLPFTLAVIKETLRMFPLSSATREGEPGYFLSHQGRHYPTEGCTIWAPHEAMHHEPLYWPHVDRFLPERWLVPEGDPLRPIKGAWRPFEWGPRNCIGQELALLELKLVMVMTLREFDIRPSYDEWDRAQGREEGSKKTMNGERAYQALKGTTRPADGFPCRVSIAGRMGG